MSVTFYKGCAIVRSDSHTTVRRRYGEALVPLYRVKGTVEKPEGRRPFLTSIADAKRYISQEIDARTYGNVERQ